MRRDLVEAAMRGDHEAFEVLATSAGDRLYAVARLILRSTDLAEDAVQEALVRAWQHLPSLRDPDKFDAWLHRLVVNACADQGRQLRRWSQQVRPLPIDASINDDTGSVADREQLERGKLLPCANKRFLHRVLRQVGRPKDQASDRVQAITGGGREDFERLVVSVACRLDEIAPHSLSITHTVLFCPVLSVMTDVTSRVTQ